MTTNDSDYIAFFVSAEMPLQRSIMEEATKSAMDFMRLHDGQCVGKEITQEVIYGWFSLAVTAGAAHHKALVSEGLIQS